jgi:mycothiol synthase
LPVRNFTRDQLPALLDFAESCSSWGDQGRDLGRRTFQDKLGQPGLAPEENCLLLEEDGRLQGYSLVFPEPPISRAVLELEVAASLAGSTQESDLVRWSVARAGKLSARVIHICLPDPSPKAEKLQDQGFALVRRYWDMVWRRDALPSAPIPDGFSVRPFQPGNAAVLTEIQNATFSGSWGFSPNTLEQIEYRISMADTSPQGILFLNQGDNTAGYCWTCLSPVDGSIRGTIGMIGVSPDYRGRGISSAILLAGMEYLRSLDVADIRLQVDGSNTPATRLYTSVGFEKAGELHWFEGDLS